AQESRAVQRPPPLVVAADLQQEVVPALLGHEKAGGVADAVVILAVEETIEVEEELRGAVFLPVELVAIDEDRVAVTRQQQGLVRDVLLRQRRGAALAGLEGNRR